MKKIFFLMLATIALITTSCNVAKQANGAYNLTKCEYSYHSVSDMVLSGINLNSSSLSPLNILKLTAIFSGKASSIPLHLTLNVNVKNPNSTPAILNGLQYIISVDDIEFTTGRINQQINIASGTTSMVSLNIDLDLASLMKTYSKDAIINIGKNIAGISGEQSKVTLQLKPIFLIGGVPVASPVYYPVNFTFGGK